MYLRVQGAKGAMTKKVVYAAIFLLFVLACGSTNELPTLAPTIDVDEVKPPATATDTPGAIERPTNTPEPTDTNTPKPTTTPKPTETKQASKTPRPTNTAVPPTNTPQPVPTQAPAPTTSPPLPTNTPIPPPPPPTEPPPPAPECDCSGNIDNCGDFGTHAQAQACHDYCMGVVGTDIHKLDGNNDGSACESLP